MWKLSDLAEANMSVFLFGHGTHEQYGMTTLGSIILLVGAKVLPPKQQGQPISLGM